MEEIFVLSLGGSLISQGADNCIDINFDYALQFRDIILKLMESGNKFVIVCGGGRVCRLYQSFGTKIDISDKNLDWMGIAATRLNAELIKSVFGDKAYGEIILDPNNIPDTEKVVFSGGYVPGHSSDNVAVLIAKTIGAKKIINLSNVDYLYDSDPKENPDAKKIESISWEDFHNIVGTEWVPGKHMVFDPIAAKTARDNNMEVYLIGSDLINFRNIIEGKDFRGTKIS